MVVQVVKYYTFPGKQLSFKLVGIMLDKSGVLYFSAPCPILIPIASYFVLQ
jgi:hypothetical protein